MKMLLINNEKHGIQTEWLALLRNKILEVSASVDVIPYHEVRDVSFYNKSYDGIVLGGREAKWALEKLPSEYKDEITLIQKSEIPILGICAGHELIGLSFGASLDRMRDGENSTSEEGFVNIFIKEHPLFRELKNPSTMYMFHGDELNSLPACFVKIASSEKCSISGISHKEKSIYGVQFHPEKYTLNYPDGKTVIKNFINLIRTLRSGSL